MKLKTNEYKDKYLDLVIELKKNMGYEGDGDTSRNWHTRYSHQRIDNGTGRRGNQKTSSDYLNDSII